MIPDNQFVLKLNKNNVNNLFNIIQSNSDNVVGLLNSLNDNVRNYFVENLNKINLNRLFNIIIRNGGDIYAFVDSLNDNVRNYFVENLNKINENLLSSSPPVVPQDNVGGNDSQQIQVSNPPVVPQDNVGGNDSQQIQVSNPLVTPNFSYNDLIRNSNSIAFMDLNQHLNSPIYPLVNELNNIFQEHGENIINDDLYFVYNALISNLRDITISIPFMDDGGHVLFDLYTVNGNNFLLFRNDPTFISMGSNLNSIDVYNLIVNSLGFYLRNINDINWNSIQPLSAANIQQSGFSNVIQLINRLLVSHQMGHGSYILVSPILMNVSYMLDNGTLSNEGHWVASFLRLMYTQSGDFIISNELILNSMNIHTHSTNNISLPQQYSAQCAYIMCANMFSVVTGSPFATFKFYNQNAKNPVNPWLIFKNLNYFNKIVIVDNAASQVPSSSNFVLSQQTASFPQTPVKTMPPGFVPQRDSTIFQHDPNLPESNVRLDNNLSEVISSLIPAHYSFNRFLEEIIDSGNRVDGLGNRVVDFNDANFLFNNWTSLVKNYISPSEDNRIHVTIQGDGVLTYIEEYAFTITTVNSGRFNGYNVILADDPSMIGLFNCYSGDLGNPIDFSAVIDNLINIFAADTAHIIDNYNGDFLYPFPFNTDNAKVNHDGRVSGSHWVLGMLIFNYNAGRILKLSGGYINSFNVHSSGISQQYSNFCTFHALCNLVSLIENDFVYFVHIAPEVSGSQTPRIIQKSSVQTIISPPPESSVQTIPETPVVKTIISPPPPESSVQTIPETSQTPGTIISQKSKTPLLSGRKFNNMVEFTNFVISPEFNNIDSGRNIETIIRCVRELGFNNKTDLLEFTVRLKELNFSFHDLGRFVGCTVFAENKTDGFIDFAVVQNKFDPVQLGEFARGANLANHIYTPINLIEKGKLSFSPEEFGGLFYGAKLTSDLNALIKFAVERKFGSVQLGEFARGAKLTDNLTDNLKLTNSGNVLLVFLARLKQFNNALLLDFNKGAKIENNVFKEFESAANKLITIRDFKVFKEIIKTPEGFAEFAKGIGLTMSNGLISFAKKTIG
jgi:hypothetical protein